MKNREWWERNQIFVYLIIIIIGLAAIKIKYGNKQDIGNQESVISDQLKTTITPTVVASPSASDIVEKDYPLENMLPHYAKGWTVEKYSAPMTLEMTVTTASESGAINEVTEWINSFGEAIGQHKIVISK
jgi:hypothetical protein